MSINADKDPSTLSFQERLAIARRAAGTSAEKPALPRAASTIPPGMAPKAPARPTLQRQQTLAGRVAPAMPLVPPPPPPRRAPVPQATAPSAPQPKKGPPPLPSEVLAKIAADKARSDVLPPPPPPRQPLSISVPRVAPPPPPRPNFKLPLPESPASSTSASSSSTASNPATRSSSFATTPEDLGITAEELDAALPDDDKGASEISAEETATLPEEPEEEKVSEEQRRRAQEALSGITAKYATLRRRHEQISAEEPSANPISDLLKAFKTLLTELKTKKVSTKEDERTLDALYERYTEIDLDAIKPHIGKQFEIVIRQLRPFFPEPQASATTQNNVPVASAPAAPAVPPAPPAPSAVTELPSRTVSQSQGSLTDMIRAGVQLKKAKGQQTVVVDPNQPAAAKDLMDVLRNAVVARGTSIQPDEDNSEENSGSDFE